ncbi:gamma-D-glutamyl-meso-diaminopimelate peptidase [Paenalkalicoccus suaedae]|uniref:Gamma-D-glutamyl-meso-diaminopimelate peptidase n=1 Tax=Paenalkalicoccus suaedae TaxID=2592382 RepID=A0A859FI81_9BACI|nr:M14 family zinc carboxypeptidase [Paenalkalicoccus suaedae]QKS72404.1 gamma-D-glutamyl-meso-diaminopimelate peptidase [Paenalkalicoccus suaedae]
MSHKLLYISTAIVTLLLFFLFTSDDAQASAIVNPNQVYTYEIMQQDLQRLEERYPDLISVEVIGTTAYGRNIYAVSVGKGLSTSYINGSNHAREWISTNLTMDMIDQYARAYSSNSSIGRYHVRQVLDHHKIWFVPMMNPDGVTLQQRGLEAFPSANHASIIRMNGGSRDFKRWKANARGVDLNRQFNAGWTTIPNDPGFPSHENHRGTAPHSELETQAVIRLTERVRPEMAVSYHSSGQILFWHYNQRGAQLSRDRVHARAISLLTGYRLMGQHGSYSGGGYTDWFINTYKKPAFTPELAPYVGNTHVPLSLYPAIWNQNREVGLYVAQQSHNTYLNRLRQTVRPANLTINNVPYTAQPGAVVLDGRTLVPVRGVVENLGATVDWDQASRTATIYGDGVTMKLPLYQTNVDVNGERATIDSPVNMIDNRTMVPIRFVSELLGADVHWEQSTSTVIITN